MSKRARGYLKLKAVAFLLAPHDKGSQAALRSAADTVLRLMPASAPDARLARAAQAAAVAHDDAAARSRLQQALDGAVQASREAGETDQDAVLPYYARGQYA